MLEVRDLEVNYGAINAIKKISFDVNEGEVIALIGANGAGKTTTLHTITGLLKAKSGSVMFEGKELLKTPPHKIVEMGMAHVPEGRRVFQQLSVYKNLTLGAFTRKDKDHVEETLRMVYEKFPRLEERKKQIASRLPNRVLARFRHALVLCFCICQYVICLCLCIRHNFRRFNPRRLQDGSRFALRALHTILFNLIDQFLQLYLHKTRSY